MSLSNFLIYALTAFIVYQAYKIEGREDRAFHKGYERGLKDGRESNRSFNK
jgi:hypothetical protein